MTANLYPLFLNLRDRSCVVIGASEMAEGKIRELLEAGAKVRVVSVEVTSQIASWAESGKVYWEARNYERGDLRGAFLVVSVADAETNTRVLAEAEEQHTFCNAVDDIPHCSCYASAIVRRGPLQIAISTAGNSPALAQRLRHEFEACFGEEYGPWVEELGKQRSLLFRDETISAEARRKMLHEQASAGAFEVFRASHLQEDDTHNSVTRDSRNSG